MSDPPGWFQFADALTDANATSFLVRQFLGQARTAAIVQVQAVNPAGTGALKVPVGTVNAKILVKLMDSLGGVSSHGIVYNLPYFRLQGGGNAIVCDPAVGDIGSLLVADRDISAVKKAQAEAPPGSFRRMDLADGMYFGGFLNGAPTQYIQFTDTGINISDKNGNTIVMDSSGVTINGFLIPRSSSGNWQTHVHSGVTTGGGDTGPHT